MAKRQLGRWWSLSLVTAGAAVVAWALYLVWRSPNRDDLSTYGAFALPVAIIVTGWLVRVWQKEKTGPAVGTLGSETLNHSADRLAMVVRKQWEKAAADRGLTETEPIRITWRGSRLSLTGPLKAAIDSKRFDPLPGLQAPEAKNLKFGQIEDLHALYGGLPSGRLFIIGPPGSGKSGAAVLLLLAALRHRRKVSADVRSEVPVPVIVTAQGWDPSRQPFTEWLARKLEETYPLFTDSPEIATASSLLDSGRIAVIIDGLDEIDPELRPVFLQALSRQAIFRIVISSRISEIKEAAKHHGLLHDAAVVELTPVKTTDAVDYLKRTQFDPLPREWSELTERLVSNPSDPLSRALNNPLTLTLVRDTCQSKDIKSLLRFRDVDAANLSPELAVEAITDHLLGRVLLAAYTHRPGDPHCVMT